MIRPLAMTVTAVLLFGCSDPPAPDSEGPPSVPRHEHLVEAAGGTRVDPYYWLRDDDRESPAVLDYLRAENAWTEAWLAPRAALRDALVDEMRARIPVEQDSDWYTDGGYRYWTRYVEGGEYPVYMRRALDAGADEEVLLDGNALAAGRAFFRIGGFDVSPDGRCLVWLQDVVGRRQYRMFIKDLDDATVLDTGIDGVASASWAADGNSLFYVENHPETLRSWRVRRYWPDDGRRRLVHEEDDEAFYTRVGRTRSDRFNYIYLDSTEATEMRVIDSGDRHARPEVLLARRQGHRYSADHVGPARGADGGYWYIRSNWNAPNYRILRAPTNARDDRAAWREVVAHDPEVFIHEFDPFERYLALGERSGGLRRIRIVELDGGRTRRVEFDESVYTAQLGRNPDPATDRLQLAYTSLTTPRETWSLDMATGQRRRIDRLEVPGGFDPAEYVTWREWVEARDGRRVPVSLVRHRDTPLDGSAPLYQYGYGAYGSTIDPAFSSARLTLLERGFVFAIAHVRGSQALGREWYEQGRLLQKTNTFTDFIDVTRGLVERGLVDPGQVFAMGGSAGGLLMGAVANMAPDDYAGIIAHVPFVDVVTTMLDASIPLTTNEYDEWGNPADPAFYRYMLGYSPYDNVRRRDYPAMLVTTGLWDSQVQYWEPAKWVARLRARKTDSNPLLLRVNMQAGHGGRSGRFRRLEQTALEYTFVLDRAGLLR